MLPPRVAARLGDEPVSGLLLVISDPSESYSERVRSRFARLMSPQGGVTEALTVTGPSFAMKKKKSAVDGSSRIPLTCAMSAPASVLPNVGIPHAVVISAPASAGTGPSVDRIIATSSCSWFALAYSPLLHWVSGL